MKKKILAFFLVATIAVSMVASLAEVHAAPLPGGEEEEEYLSYTGGVVGQYTQGTTATTYLSIATTTTTETSYGVVVNGTKYPATGTVVDGRYLVKLSNLTSQTTYKAYPYAGSIVAEEAMTFTTEKTTTTSGNASSYYSLQNSGISYSFKDMASGVVDIQGAGQKKTTYGNGGWAISNSNSTVSVYAVPTIVTGVSGQQYIKLSYIVRNNNKTAISNYKFGLHSDSMIGTNDRAPVYTTNYGVRVAESTSTDALSFAVITKSSNAADGLGRQVNNVSTQWYGNYSSRTANVYNAGPTTTLTGVDSGIALSWQNISLEPGEAKTYSTIFGIANNDILSATYEQLSAPVLVSKTYNQITIDTVAGQSYFIENASGIVERYDCKTNGKYTFTGLVGGTTYKIYTEKSSQSEVIYIASNNTIVTTDATPSLKTSIENVASYKAYIGGDTDIVELLSQKIPGLTGNVKIESAELVNPEDEQYLTLSSDGKRFTTHKLSPVGYKINIKITSMTVDYSEQWGHNVVMNDVIVRTRIVESESPYVTKHGTEITIHSNDYRAVKLVNYSYTGAQKQDYKSWYSFWKYGISTPELLAVNGSNGYRSLRGVVNEAGLDVENEPVFTSTIDGAKIKLSKIGSYTFLLTDQNNHQYIQYVTIDANDYAVGKPRLYQDQNSVKFVNNNSGLKKVNYIYSGDQEYQYKSWYSFVTTGKQFTTENTANGYRTKAGTSQSSNQSTLDGNFVRLEKAGWYTFLMTYGDGEEIAYTIYINDQQAQYGIPYVTLADTGNGANIFDNHSQLTKVTYQYSDPTNAYKYIGWYSFTVNGKRFSDLNTSNGYRSISGKVVDNVSTLNAQSINLTKSGWYTFLFTYVKDGVTVESTQTLFIEQDFSDISVAADGYNIKYHDGLVAGKFSEYAYEFIGANEPDLTQHKFQATSSNKVSMDRDSSGGNFDFTVSQAGWYVLKVTDSVIGTQYYKVKVVAPEAITKPSGNSFPYLSVEGGTINAYFDASTIKFMRIGNTGKYSSGASLQVTETGMYNVEIIDAKGRLYSLVAFVTFENDKVELDKSSLEASIKSAQEIKDKYIVVDDLGAQTEPGTYVSTKERNTLLTAIETASLAKDSATTQTQLNQANTALKEAITKFKASAKTIISQFVSVNENTITISPTKANDRLSKVYYNVENGEITPHVANSWTQLCYKEKIKVDRFNEAGDLVIANVADGIYTFLIGVEENGVYKEYIQYAIVAHTGNLNEVAKDAIQKQNEQASSLLNSVKKESEAQLGESFIPDAMYVNLENSIKNGNELLLGEIDVNKLKDKVMDFLSTTQGQIKQAQSSIKVKEEQQEEVMEKATIQIHSSINEANVTIASKDIANVYVAPGRYSSWYSFSQGGAKKYLPKNQSVQYTALVNGPYTALVTYRNGKQEYQYFEIANLVYPITITQENGLISVSTSELSIASIAYGYGDEFSNISDKKLISETISDDKKHSFKALGNGVHTIFIKATNGFVYKMDVSVDTCTQPVLIEKENTFAAFANGFDISAVALAKGEFTQWSEMYAVSKYFSLNTWIDTTTLEPGVYTICFIGNGNQYYFKTISIA